MPVETTSKAVGILGERLAFSYLRKRGYKILLANYVSPVGEIDLVARDGSSLVFVEVKTRRSEAMGVPAESVTFRKRRQIVKAAQYYLKEYNLFDRDCRFDVVSIYLFSETEPRIELIQNAFNVE